MEKRLYRSTKDKYIGGVCGGLAEYFGIDPAIIRILFLLLFFAEGAGLLAYIVFWIAVRRRPESEPYSGPTVRSATWSRYLPGLILVLVGVVFLVHENWYWLDLDGVFEHYWPVLLIFLGAALILFRGHNGNRETTGPTQHQNGEATL